jgi:hypothetical protein
MTSAKRHSALREIAFLQARIANNRRGFSHRVPANTANADKTHRARRTLTRCPEHLWNLGLPLQDRRTARGIRDPVVSPIHLSFGSAAQLCSRLSPEQLARSADRDLRFRNSRF